MSSNVSPEEAEALLAGGSPTARSVALRDFRKPHRLSRAQQAAIRQAVGLRLLEIERGLRVWLRADYPLELLDVGETSYIGLFEDLEDPIVALTLDTGGAAGWIVWETPAALAAATVAMGSEPPESIEDRGLTPIEAGVIGDILFGIAREIGNSLGVALTGGPMSLDVRTFLLQLDPSETADPQRLFLHLGLTGPGGESTVRVYLPGLLPEKPAAATGRVERLPDHLAQVPLEISAQLGNLEIALQDLMKVEIGDVIPLSLSVGEPLEVLIEGEVAGKASWGACRGRLALRIEHLETEIESDPS